MSTVDGGDAGPRPVPSSRPSSRPLWADWEVHALLALIAGLGLWFALAPAGFPVKIAAYWTVQPVFDLVMLLSSRRVAARAARQPSAAAVARFWRWLARSAALFVTGDVIEAVTTWHNPAAGSVGGGSPHGLLVASGVLIMIVVSLTHPSGLSGAQRRRMWMDALIVTFGAAAAAWYLDAAHSLLGGLVLATGAMVSVFGLVRLALSAQPPFTRLAGTLGVVGVGLTGVSDALAGGPGTPSGAALWLRLLPSVAVALAPRIQELELQTVERIAASRRGTYSRLPYLAVAASQALLVLVAAQGGWAAQAWGPVVCSVLVTALVVVRQLDDFREKAALLARLDASLLDRHRAERRYRSLVQNSSDITLIIAADGSISYASPALRTLLGVDPGDAVGRPVTEFVPLPVPAADGGVEGLRGLVGRTTRMALRHAAGTVRWIEVTLTDLVDDPSVQGLVCNGRDVTDAHELQQRLLHQASHDGLTRLVNRAAFDEEVSRARVGGGPVAAVMIDLDGFKPVNDTHGHHVGDQLLVHVAERLRRCVRDGDVVARLGGDEFAILLHGATRGRAEAVARRVAAAIDQPFAITGKRLRIGASVGVAVGDGVQVEALLHRADAAMFQAKRARRAARGRALAPRAGRSAHRARPARPPRPPRSAGAGRLTGRGGSAR